jgi:hypothetical protein
MSKLKSTTCVVIAGGIAVAPLSFGPEAVKLMHDLGKSTGVFVNATVTASITGTVTGPFIAYDGSGRTHEAPAVPTKPVKTWPV